MTYRTQINSGAVANLPLSGQAGALYLPTNGIAVYENNGTSWQSWGPTPPINIPTAINTNFGWINQGTSTQTFNNAGMLLTSQASGSNANLLQSNSNTTSGFVETGFQISYIAATQTTDYYIQAASVMYNTSNGDYVFFGLKHDLNFNDPKSYVTLTVNGTLTEYVNVQMGMPVFVKLAIVGSNIIGYITHDRVNYLQMFSTSLSTALGSGLTSSTFRAGVGVITQTYTTQYVNFFHYMQG
jgi:hypothetical protein